MTYSATYLSARNAASFPRPLAARPAGRGQLVGAAARVDITPPLGLPPGGHGFGFADLLGILTPEQTAQQAYGRMFATVLLLQDAQGSGVALIAADLHTGTRYLAEAIARRTAALTGLGVDRIFLGASHAHSGPGHLYGDSFYDNNAAHAEGLDQGTAEDLARRIADTIVRLHRDALAPVRVRSGIAHAFGTLWNRSHMAALANAGEPRFMTPSDRRTAARAAARRMNGRDAPADLDLDRLLIDARVQSLVLTDAHDAPLGVWATCHATPTALPGSLRILSPDSFGFAAHHARLALHARGHGWVDPLGIVGGAMGDVNVLPRDMRVQDFREMRFGADAGGHAPTDAQLRRAGRLLDLSRDVGREIGEALTSAVVTALTSPPREVPHIRVRFAEPCVAGSTVGPERLPDEWKAGRATLAMSELARQGDVGSLFEEEESDRARKEQGLEDLLMPVDPSDPHSPKRDLAGLTGLLQRLIERSPGLHSGLLPPFIPVRRVEIGPLQLIGVPLEPSAALGRDLAERLSPNAPDDVLISGLNGGCVGYAGTVAEYRVQDYEGASTFWGRAFGAWLIEQVATAPLRPPGAAPQGDAVFVGTVLAKPPFALAMPATRSVRNVRPDRLAELTIRGVDGGLRLDGFWRADATVTVPPLADQPWITLTDGAGGPLLWNGRPLDDRAVPVWLRREVRPLQAGVTWAFRLQLPREALPAKSRVGFSVTGPPAVQPPVGWVRPAASVPGVLR